MSIRNRNEMMTMMMMGEDDEDDDEVEDFQQLRLTKNEIYDATKVDLTHISRYSREWG